MRIAWFIVGLEIGGSERQLIALNEGLKPFAWERHIICLSGFGPLADQARAAGATLHDLAYARQGTEGRIGMRNVPEAFRAVMRLRTLLLRIQPDILHTIVPVCNILGAPAGRLARVPRMVCSKVWPPDYRGTSRIFDMLENISDRMFDIVHCKSQGVADAVVAREPVPRSKIRVVYNGIRPERFEGHDREATRRELAIEPDEFLVGVVANLFERKGHRDLLVAAPAVLREFPRTRFVLVGRDEGLGPALHKQANDLGIAERVLFAGERPNVPELLAGFDLLVSSSHQEGFSNVVIEGMAAGLPIVATNACGNDEAIEDGVSGILVPVRSPERLAAAIIEMRRKPDRARKMGERGRERVARLFSHQAMVDGMRQIYGELTTCSNRRA